MKIDIEHYYKKYGAMVLRRCRFLLKDEEQAFDAMQDVFVRLLRYKKKLSGTYPSSLLYTIATNVCLNILRKEKASEPANQEWLVNIASKDSFEQRLEHEELLEIIFNEEKESTRTIAVMYLIDGMTHQQVANEVGMSVSGVRKRLRKLQLKSKNFAFMEV